MKVFVLLAGGAVGDPLAELEDRSILEAAKTPALDRLAAEGTAGAWVAAPPGRPPGADTAIYELLGCQKRADRGPLEAAAADIPLRPGEAAFRVNFVCLRPGTTSVVMLDQEGCGLSDEEGEELTEYLRERLMADPDEEIDIHPLGGARAVLTYRKDGFEAGEDALGGFSPAYEVLGQPIGGHLPSAKAARRFVHLVNDSQMILAGNPMVKEKLETSMFAANSLWLWGGGTRPDLPPLSSFLGGRSVALISTARAAIGLGRLGGAGEILSAPGGAEGRGEMVAAARKSSADVVIVCADDAAEAARRGDMEGAISAIEAFDSEILAPLLENPGSEACRILALADRALLANISIKGSAGEPWAMADWKSGALKEPDLSLGIIGSLINYFKSDGPSRSDAFSEKLCENSRPLTGRELLARLIGK